MLLSVTLRLLFVNITTIIWNIDFSICQEIFNVVTKSQAFLSEGVISEDDSQNPGFLKGWLPSQMRFIQQMFNNQWSLELLTDWTCHCIVTTKVTTSTVFCSSLTSQLLLCLALLQCLCALTNRRGRPILSSGCQNEFLSGWLFLSSILAINTNSNIETRWIFPLLPCEGCGNLDRERSPLRRWSTSLCRSQSPGFPTPGSPFIHFS